jgi:hypothetical protein
MATVNATLDGIIIDLTHSEVTDITTSEDLAAAAAGVISAVLATQGGWLGLIAGIAAAGLAATIAIHKVEFQNADLGNGVEVTLPLWAVALGWWGILFMKPLPPSKDMSGTWPSMGGHDLQSRPSVATNADSRQEVFVLGGDRALYHNWETAPGAAWIGWVPLGGQSLQLPVITANGADGRLYTFVRGGDGAVYYRRQVIPNGDFEDWTGPGAPPAPLSGFAAARNADGRLEIVGVGNDGNLYDMWQTSPDGTWSGWASLEAHGLSGPVCFGANADGRLEAFAVGGDGLTYHRWQTQPNGQGGWSGWQNLGDPSLPAISDIALARRADGSLVVFMMRSDAALCYRSQAGPNNAFDAPVHLAGHDLRWPCTVGRHADGGLDVFAIGGDGIVYHRQQPNVAQPDLWRDWAPISGGQGTRPGMAAGSIGGQLELYAVGADGQLHRSP